MKAAVDMLKKEQAKVIKAFEKVLDAIEIKQGKEVTKLLDSKKYRQMRRRFTQKS